MVEVVCNVVVSVVCVLVVGLNEFMIFLFGVCLKCLLGCLMLLMLSLFCLILFICVFVVVLL